MADYFYARVSAVDQNLDRQLIAANGRGVPSANIFTEKLSGKDTKRPELQRLMSTVKSGDTVTVESISRFARNTRDLLDLVEKLNAKGVEFVSLKENIDTTTPTPTGKFMLTVFGAGAELERGYILQRQREGIAAARGAWRPIWPSYKKAPRKLPCHRPRVGARQAGVCGGFGADRLERSHVLQPFEGIPRRER